MARHHGFWAAGILFLSLVAGGCSSTRGTDPDARPEIEVPEKTYKGLAQQTCAIMVWADPRTRTEYNQVQLDLARLIEQRLVPPPPAEGEKPSKEDKQRQANLPKVLLPASVVRYQREHPEIEGQPITEVAPHLGGATRVIYVELEQFDLHSPRSIMLLKGTAKCTLRVVEVSGTKAYIAFEEHGITAHYPPNAPEGVVDTGDNTPKIYKGTLSLMADKIVARFEDAASRED